MKYSRSSTYVAALVSLTVIFAPQALAQGSSDFIKALSVQGSGSAAGNQPITTTAASREALAQFEQILHAADIQGDETARENLDRLATLSSDEKQELGEALASHEADKALVAGESTAGIVIDNNISLGENEGTYSPYAWNGWDTAEGCATAKKFGISISRVCTGGSYHTRAGLVTRVTGVYSHVRFNYQPGSTIITSNPRGMGLGNLALFQADVSNTYFANNEWGPFGQFQGTHNVLVTPSSNTTGQWGI